MKILFKDVVDDSIVYLECNLISFYTDDDTDHCYTCTRGKMTLSQDGYPVLDRSCSMSYGEYIRLIRLAVENDFLDLSETPYKFHFDEE